jgi:hypothetical protein
MSAKMIEYFASPDYSIERYKKACKFIEDLFGDDLIKKDVLIDVDGSQVQVYITPKGEVVVINAFDYDWVLVRSEFEIQNPDWTLWK